MKQVKSVRMSKIERLGLVSSSREEEEEEREIESESERERERERECLYRVVWSSHRGEERMRRRHKRSESTPGHPFARPPLFFRPSRDSIKTGHHQTPPPAVLLVAPYLSTLSLSYLGPCPSSLSRRHAGVFARPRSLPLLVHVASLESSWLPFKRS